MNEVFIVNDFSGVQKGTKDNPYSVRTAGEYDGLIASLRLDENGAYRRFLLINLGAGEFLTGGCYQYGPFSTPERPRLGRNWQIVGTGPSTTISLDPNAIPDEQVNDWPMHLMCSASQWMEYLWTGREAEWAALAPEQLWANLPEGQLIRDLTVNLNYTKLIDRWIAFEKALKLSGGILQGHGGSYENVTVRNFGAYHVVDADGKVVGGTAEAFPLVTVGCMDGFDRNILAKLPPSYVFDGHLPDAKCAHMTGCQFFDYSDADSNDQVSLNLVLGSKGQPSLSAFSAGDETSPFVHHYRKFAYQQHNLIQLPDTNSALKNQVQAFTMYQTLRADCSFNKGTNIHTGYYSDWDRSFNVDIHDNEFLRVLRGAAFLLSPVGPDNEHFASTGHKVRRNTISQVGTASEWHAGVLLWQFDNGTVRDLSNITIGGKGEENTFSIDGPAGGANIAIKAVGVNKLTVGENHYDSRYGKSELVTIGCQNVITTKISFWRKIGNFFKRLFGGK